MELNPTIPFFRPSITKKDIQSVAQVLRSHWLTSGPKVNEFEENFKKFTGATHAVALNSCTAALHLALDCIGLQSGDEVIVPVFTFAATAEVVEYFGAKPVFVDVRWDTLNIDETKIEKAITKRTRAIIPVHYAGHPCEMGSIQKLCRKYGLILIEDAAHSLPALYKDRFIGTISDMTCFSFYANKCITTGEGGMLTTHRKEWADKIRSLSLHGISRDGWQRYGQKGNWRYDILYRGYKYNMPDILAALGVVQLKRANRLYHQRRRIARLYQSLLKDQPQLLCPVELPHCQHAWHLYTIRLKENSSIKRDELFQYLQQKGIKCSVHFIPLHLFSFYKKKYHYKPQDYPVSYRAFEGVLSLPLYPELTNERIRYIVRKIVDTL